MKKTLLFALALAGASAFAQKASDTTFVMITSYNDARFQEQLPKPSFEFFMVKDVLYHFYKQGDSILGLPMDLPAPIIIYPKEQHVSKAFEFLSTERYKSIDVSKK